MRWRPHDASRIELFIAGIMVSAALGYVLQGSSSGIAVTLLLAGVLLADAIRRGGGPGLWLVILAFCAALSRLDVTQTEQALGNLRVPLIVGGSLLAIAAGYVFDAEFRAALKRTRP